MKNIKLIFILMLSIPILITSCQKNKNVGNLTLSITDAPIDRSTIKALYLTITEVQYHKNDKEWAVFEDFEGPQKFNILELVEGESALMGSFKLEAGKYTQLRFILDAPEYGTQNHTNPGCYIEFNNDSLQPIFVPSGSESGWKGVGKFTVPVNGNVSVTADFDARKSLFEAGSSNNYILKPTIRLIVDNQAGQISGNVTNLPDSTDIFIYVYEDGAYTPEEADDPINDLTPRFPNAVTSDDVNSEGNYKLAFLAPMTYDLAVVSSVNGEFQEVLGIVEDVIVKSKKTTSQVIDISSF